MRTTMLFLLLTVMSAGSAMAGNCDHAWQTAKDGSSCGGRAADQRAGGSDGW